MLLSKFFFLHSSQTHLQWLKLSYNCFHDCAPLFAPVQLKIDEPVH